MTVFFVLLTFVLFAVSVVFLIKWILEAVRKNGKSIKSRNRFLIAIGVTTASFIFAIITIPNEDTDVSAGNETTTSPVSSTNKEDEEREKAAIEESKAQAAAEAEAEFQRKKAEEELKAEMADPSNYRTDVTFDNLARTPDDFIDEKVSLSGTVAQVIELDGETQLRIAVDDNYDNVVFTYYDSTITQQRVLENDWITIYGVSEGLYSYESTMGGQITVPLIGIKIIE